ncbi:Plasmodium exported protein, unknown function [Plasmodium vivax]|uniref:Variable surface protein n=1 Tax=Plasmodium vivax TaxID=5855 RepID=A0A565A5H5_PLAVI|nr:Plasmodium exported protein, unknown function [Plasmodium vivax]
MELLGYNKLKDIVKFVVVLNLFTYILLILDRNNDVRSLNKSFEKIYNHDRSLNVYFNRLLAKHELKNDLYKTQVKQKYSTYGLNKNIKNDVQDKSSYRDLKKNPSNYLEDYMKNYKYRYSKKKGFNKLDCYYENKIFEKIEKIYKLAGNMNINKKKIKRDIYKKYGIRIILSSLFLLLGIIMPIFDSIYHPADSKRSNNCHSFLHESGIPMGVYIFHNILFLIIVYVILFGIIYTIIKVIKYESLKAGRGKIKGKEYYRFGKKIFI